jgi:AcrR family transcriptional regulator
LDASVRTSGTGAKLIAAAAAEFNDHGFGGTDTNKIARRAGFAPQTFYRWFRDKTEIFVAVYRLWEEEERKVVARLLSAGASDAEIAEAGVDQHRRYLNFRRSLRRLSLEDPAIRQARAESRRRQIVQLKKWSKAAAQLEDADVATALLTLERLTDALAEGEFTDMGVDETSARTRIAAIFAGLRHGKL